MDERHAEGAPPIVPAKTVAAPAKKVVRTMPAFTRGIHVSAPWAGQPGNLDSVLSTPGLNLIQLDVKDESGEVSGLGARTPALAVPQAPMRDYYDLAHVTRLAHDRHIWVVARIVSFKDPIVARSSPRIAIRDVHGGIWKDGGGVPWLNQYNPGAWAYLINLAKAAARSGVDEVQFDYVRFPSEGDALRHALPGQGQGAHRTRRSRASSRPPARRSKPFDVKLGVDVFGLAADHDLGIGQDIAR